MLVELDLDRLSAPWRYDDADAVYPHVYGPLDLDAVLSVRRLARDRDGRFLPLDAPD